PPVHDRPGKTVPVPSQGGTVRPGRGRTRGGGGPRLRFTGVEKPAAERYHDSFAPAAPPRRYGVPRPPTDLPGGARTAGDSRRQGVHGMADEPTDSDRPVRGRSARTLSFLGRRFSRDEYLGLHLTMGMLLSLALLGFFGVVAHNVIGDTRLTEFDTAVGLWLEEHRQAHPLLRTAFGLVTEMGSKVTLTVLAVLVALYLFGRRRRLLPV